MAGRRVVTGAFAGWLALSTMAGGGGGGKGPPSQEAVLALVLAVATLLALRRLVRVAWGWRRAP